MRHGVAAQVDSFGVWQLELDGGVEKATPDTIYIGHDRAGSGLPGNFHMHVSLDAFLHQLTDTEAFRYRPIILFFECKCGSGDWNCSFDNTISTLEKSLIRSVGREHLFTPADYRSFQDQGFNGWPSVAQLAGKLIVWTADDAQGLSVVPSLVFAYYPGLSNEVIPKFIRRLHSGSCVNDPSLIGNEIAQTPEGYGNLISLDQYQDEVSWTYCVPPNPLHVGGTSFSSTITVNNPGCMDDSDCPSCSGINTNYGATHEVRHHGARGFPDPVPSAAYGSLVAHDCWGWTMKFASGHYPGAWKIYTPLRLEADDHAVAIIGQ